MSNRKKNKYLNELPVYTGEFNTKTRIQCISYSYQNFSDEEVSTPQEALSRIHGDCVTWIRVFGMTDTNLILNLIKEVGLNELDAKDILTTQHIMSIEEYDKNIFMVMPVSYLLGGKRYSEQLAIVMGKNYLITIKESDHPIFDTIYNGIKNNKNQKFSSHNSSFLLASILNEVISFYGDEIVHLEDKLEELEDQLLEINQGKNTMISDIQERRRELIGLRKMLVPFKDQFSKLLRVDPGLVDEKDIPYFKDIYDQLLYILQNIESCREILSSLVDLYLSNNDVKMNRVMKQLTLVATIFIPLTFLVGVWGMNFEYMPELGWEYGYLFAWIIMIVIGVGVWGYLKKKDWT